MKIFFMLVSKIPMHPLYYSSDQKKKKKKLNLVVIDFGVNKADVKVTETWEKRKSLLTDRIQLSQGLQSKHWLSELEKAASLQLVSLMQCYETFIFA